MIDQYSDKVRVRRNPCGWMDVKDNIFVEIFQDDAWAVFWATNEVSNGRAYTEAKAKALALVQKVI